MILFATEDHKVYGQKEIILPVSAELSGSIVVEKPQSKSYIYIL